MPNFPDSIFSPRVVADRIGVVYDALKTKVFFAKDHNDFGYEIVAIENALGLNPEGTFSSVSERLDIMEYYLVNWGELLEVSDEMTAPANDDLLAIANSANDFIMEKISWANIKARLKTYFDTLYPIPAKTIFYNYTLPDGLVGYSTSSTSDEVVTTTKFGAVGSIFLSDIPSGKKLYCKIAVRVNITSGKKAYFKINDGASTYFNMNYAEFVGTGSNVNYASNWIEVTPFTEGKQWVFYCKVDAATTLTGANKGQIVFAWGD